MDIAEAERDVPIVPFSARDPTSGISHHQLSSQLFSSLAERVSGMIASKLCVVALVALALAAFAAATPERPERLIALSEDDEGTWMTKLQVLQLVQDDITFMDITDRPETVFEVPEGPPLPNQPQQKTLVNSLNSQLDMNNMQSNVEILSSYKTRFYSTETGVEACDWIHDTLIAYAGPLSSSRAPLTPPHERTQTQTCRRTHDQHTAHARAFSPPHRLT